MVPGGGFAYPWGAMPEGATCLVCGRPTYDPQKRERPWARGVSGGRLVLICPTCQSTGSDWTRALDRCARCGGTRLSVTLGTVICRACGHEVDRGARADA